MISPRQIRTKTSRTTQELVNTGTAGPFLAKVIGHLDQTFMGGLKVQLLRTTSSADNDSQDGEIVTVQYASPFSGATPIYGAGGADNYSNTQKSYGFWAVPPDVGSKVLVTFVEGRRDFGFWFACVQDDFMNFMIPDGRAATSNTTGSVPEYYKGKKLPVGEYNKHLIDPQGQAQPTYYPRPVNDDYLKRMEEQGLVEDDVRGLTSSSARREVPSNVYGMSTPGPLDKRSNAPKVPRGTVDSEKLFFSSRLGGHSIVMDDGDEKILRKGHAKDTPQEYANLKVNQTDGDPTLPANELFRLRTRTGHQILMHNTEDLIYISNARGTAWIELTSNGKIDIYAFDSVSVHTNNDLNFTADRDINFTAYENMNFVVGKELRIDTGDSISMTTGNFYSLNAADSISQTAGEFIAGYAGSSVTLVANTDFTALGAGVSIGSTGIIGIEGCSAVKISTDGDIHNKALGSIYNSTVGDINFDTGQRFLIKTGSVVGVDAGGNIILKANTDIQLNGPTPPSPLPATLPPAPDPVNTLDPKRALQTSRQPNHEPWYQHENLNPLAYTPERTRAGSQAVNSFNIPTSDTFLPPTRQQPSGTVNSTYFPQYDGTTTEGGFQSFDGSPNVNAYRGTPGEPLPESQLVGVIDGFTKAETAAFLGAIGKRESNNAYDAVNSIGFSGKYQFGDGALEDLGYLKPGTTAKYSVKNALLISENWTGKDGITSRDAWLANTTVQEKAMLDYTNRNLKTLKRVGGVREGDDKLTISGMLAGSHLLGAGGMKKWRNGEGGADAYGTTGDEYYALGRAALQNVSSTSTTSNNTGGGPI
jgi:hypothetical protein